jgi:copper chaperone
MLTCTYRLSGMTYGHRVDEVSGEIADLRGVTVVSVDRASGVVTATSGQPLDAAAVRAVVDEAGYEWRNDSPVEGS